MNVGSTSVILAPALQAGSLSWMLTAEARIGKQARVRRNVIDVLQSCSVSSCERPSRLGKHTFFLPKRKP